MNQWTQPVLMKYFLAIFCPICDFPLPLLVVLTLSLQVMLPMSSATATHTVCA